MEGLVFNPGERVLGLTNPLVALVVGLLGLVTRMPILTLARVMALGALWAAVYAARWALEDDLWTLALIPGLFLGPQTIHFVGNEFPLVCALGLIAIGAARRNRWWLAGLCVGGLYLARFDAVLLGPVLAARARWFIAVVHSVPLARLTLGGGAAHRAMAPLRLDRVPAALSPVRSAPSSTPALCGIRFSRQFVTVHLDRAFVSGNGLAVGFLLLGCVLVGAKVLDIVGWAAVHAAFFVLLDLPGNKLWHFMIIDLALLVLIAGGVAQVSRRLAPQPLCASLLAIGFSVSIGLHSFDADKGELERFHFFANLAEWIRANVSPTETVALREIGVMGFNTDNRIVDFGYLVTAPPEFGRAGLTLQQLLERQVAYHRPDWAILNRHVQFTAEETRGFTGYEVVAQGSTGEVSNVTILRRKPDG